MKKEKKASSGCTPCERMGKVGGQAVLEGVMMKAENRSVTTCRKPDGSLVVTDDSFVSVREKHKILNIPILRGVINFVEMMILSVKTMSASADALGLEEEEETKFEKWLKKHFGMRITTFIMGIGVVLGLALSILLFLILPIWSAQGINWLVTELGGPDLGAWKKVIEGLMKAAIFVLYLWGVSFMPDIKRTFMYHGAEHKTIACYEAGEELTVENVRKHKRFHPRCGTSFMFFMILLGIIAGLVIYAIAPGLKTWVYTLIRLGILPVIMGIGYEFIRFAGKHDNVITRILSAPGLWVQRLTTKEPDDSMIEVAIISTKCALRDAHPEFMEYYLSRGWEASTADADTVAEPNDENAPAEDAEAADDAASIDTESIADTSDAAADSEQSNDAVSETKDEDSVEE